MLDALATIDVPQKVWVRRGMFRKGTSVPVDAIGRFDLIVHPGDAVPHAASEVEHGVEELHVPPMLPIDPEEMWPRDTARRRLGVPQDARVVYVQLGAGRTTTSIPTCAASWTPCSRTRTSTWCLVSRCLVSGLRWTRAVHLVRDYPNALYLKASTPRCKRRVQLLPRDAQRRSATLFLPNMNTGMDDRLARCKVAEEEGWGSVLLKQGTSALHWRLCSVLTQMQHPSMASTEQGRWPRASFRTGNR